MSILNILKNVPRRNLNNIARSSMLYTDSINVINSPQVRSWMSANPGSAAVKRMTNLDKVRLKYHNQLMEDLSTAGINLNKSNFNARRQAEDLAWEIRNKLKNRTPSKRRTIRTDAKKQLSSKSVSLVLQKAKNMGIV